MNVEKSDDAIQEAAAHDFTIAKDGVLANGQFRDAVDFDAEVFGIDIDQAVPDFDSRVIAEADDDGIAGRQPLQW